MPGFIKHGEMKQHNFKITFLDGPSLRNIVVKVLGQHA
jgi:hypothetical protein